MLIRVLAAAAAFSALGFAANAQTTGVQPYVSAGAGYLFSDGVNIPTGVVRAGADFGAYVGIEGEAAFGLDSDSDAGVDYSLDHSLAGFVRFRAPLSDSVQGFVRAGYYTAEVEAEAGPIKVSADDDDVAAGLGLEFLMGGRHGVRVDYTNYGLDDDGHAGSLAYVLHF